jgi:hypothetical protein
LIFNGSGGIGREFAGQDVAPGPGLYFSCAGAIAVSVGSSITSLRGLRSKGRVWLLDLVQVSALVLGFALLMITVADIASGDLAEFLRSLGLNRADIRGLR